MTLYSVIPFVAIAAFAFFVVVTRTRANTGKTWVKGQRPENHGKSREPRMEDVLEAVRANIKRDS